MSEELRIDLNQDGITENVCVVPEGETDWLQGHAEAISITINDITYDATYLGETFGIYTDYVDTTKFYLFDIDTTDPYLDIAFFDEGPSSDPITRIFRYQDETLNYIGYFTDQPGNSLEGSVIMPGDGTILATKRLGILQTWWAQGQWQLKDGKLVEIQREYYVPYTFSDATMITLKQDVIAFSEPDLQANAVNFKEDEEVSFVQIYQMTWPEDEEYACSGWVKMQTKDGVVGWFLCNKEHQINFYDTLVNGASEIFENLCMAD